MYAAPDTVVNLIPMDFADPWDFGEMYTALYDWTRGYRFDPERESVGAHHHRHPRRADLHVPDGGIAHHSRRAVADLPSRKQAGENPGKYTLIDLDLSRYDVLARRFSQARDDALEFLKSGIPRNRAFNRLIEEIEQWRCARRRHPADRPHRRGQVASGSAHVRTEEIPPSGPGRVRRVNCATLRGDGASTLFGHKKAPSPARPTEPACCAPPTRACCSWTRSANWACEARTRYLKFAKSAEAKWTGNFRDLSASVTRLATLADGGRIPVELVDAEIQRALAGRGAHEQRRRQDPPGRRAADGAPTRWTCSTACSWKPSSACAGNRTRFAVRGRAASSMTARAPSARWSMTPTGCAVPAEVRRTGKAFPAGKAEAGRVHQQGPGTARRPGPDLSIRRTQPACSSCGQSRSTGASGAPADLAEMVMLQQRHAIGIAIGAVGELLLQQALDAKAARS